MWSLSSQWGPDSNLTMETFYYNFYPGLSAQVDVFEIPAYC